MTWLASFAQFFDLLDEAENHFPTKDQAGVTRPPDPLVRFGDEWHVETCCSPRRWLRDEYSLRWEYFVATGGNNARGTF